MPNRTPHKRPAHRPHTRHPHDVLDAEAQAQARRDAHQQARGQQRVLVGVAAGAAVGVQHGGGDEVDGDGGEEDGAGDLGDEVGGLVVGVGAGHAREVEEVLQPDGVAVERDEQGRAEGAGGGGDGGEERGRRRLVGGVEELCCGGVLGHGGRGGQKRAELAFLQVGAARTRDALERIGGRCRDHGAGKKETYGGSMVLGEVIFGCGAGRGDLAEGFA